MDEEFVAGRWREFWWIPVGMAVAIGIAVWAVALFQGLAAIL